jgi:hypothetical protein
MLADGTAHPHGSDRDAPLDLNPSEILAAIGRRAIDRRRRLTFYISAFMEIWENSMLKSDAEETARYADMLAALGAEPRLRIVRLLLAAHPDGLVVGEIGSELGIPPSTRRIISTS